MMLKKETGKIKDVLKISSSVITRNLCPHGVMGLLAYYFPELNVKTKCTWKNFSRRILKML